MRNIIRKTSATLVILSMLAAVWNISDYAYATAKIIGNSLIIEEDVTTESVASDTEDVEVFIAIDQDGNVTQTPIEEVPAMSEEELQAIDNVQYEVIVEVDGEASVVNTMDTILEAEEQLEELQGIIEEHTLIEDIVSEIASITSVEITIPDTQEADEEVDEESAIATITESADSQVQVLATGEETDVEESTDTEESVDTEESTDVSADEDASGYSVSTTVDTVTQDIEYGVVILSGYIEFENEDGTTSYTHGSYAPDAAYLGAVDDTYMIMQSGTIGYVSTSSAYVVEYDTFVAEGNIVSTYTTSNGKLYHNITTDNKSVASTIMVGYQQSYMSNSATYYSYDGHYFYTDYKTMVTDYKNGTYANSINATNAYYSYYQYLSQRSTTSFTAAQINEYLSAKLGSSSTSVLLGTGQDFIDNQNIYGINAVLMLGVAINESGWGTSSIATTKNNVFGHGAYDNDTYNAYTYDSVSDSIAYHAETFMSKGYTNPKNWKYNGAHLGDKDGGANVKYASDPYWGEKAAAQAYLIEDYFSDAVYDYDTYQIGVTSVKIEAYNELGGTVVYNSLSGSSTIVENFPVIILGETTYDGELWYMIQSDGVLTDDRSAVNSDSGVYDFDRDYVYVKASLITLVNDADVEYTLGDPSGDGKITSLDYMMIKGHIMGTSTLTGVSLLAADASKDGKITSLDYMMIKNHIMGTYTIE